MATTRTSTKTYTRIDLLIMQVRIALNKTLNISEEKFDQIFRQGLRLKLIGSVTIYAIQSDGRCRAQLRLTIDWDRHSVHIAEGREPISIDRRWHGETAPELEVYVEGFVEFVNDHNLKTSWTL